MWRRGGSAFDRIGGASAVLTAVELLYQRAEADPELAPYFHDTSMPTQRDKLVGMVSEALGGPRSPWMTGLVEAHKGRAITHDHFDRMASHLLGILKELGVSQREVRLIARWLSTSRTAVVEEAGG